MSSLNTVVDGFPSNESPKETPSEGITSTIGVDYFVHFVD
jgi:hypothetical protein